MLVHRGTEIGLPVVAKMRLHASVCPKSDDLARRMAGRNVGNRSVLPGSGKMYVKRCTVSYSCLGRKAL